MQLASVSKLLTRTVIGAFYRLVTLYVSNG